MEKTFSLISVVFTGVIEVFNVIIAFNANDSLTLRVLVIVQAVLLAIGFVASVTENGSITGVQKNFFFSFACGMAVVIIVIYHAGFSRKVVEPSSITCSSDVCALSEQWSEDQTATFIAMTPATPTDTPVPTITPTTTPTATPTVTPTFTPTYTPTPIPGLFFCVNQMADESATIREAPDEEAISRGKLIQGKNNGLCYKFYQISPDGQWLGLVPNQMDYGIVWDPKATEYSGWVSSKLLSPKAGETYIKEDLPIAEITQTP